MWAAQIAALQWDKISTKVFTEYIDYVDVFSPNLTMKLAKNTGINEHAIKLVEDKQPRYGPIYALSLVKLKTLKAYIKTHLKTGFIWPFKSLTDIPILFNKKLDGSPCLCVHYQGLNNSPSKIVIFFY